MRKQNPKPNRADLEDRVAFLETRVAQLEAEVVWWRDRMKAGVEERAVLNDKLKQHDGAWRGPRRRGSRPRAGYGGFDSHSTANNPDTPANRVQ